MAFRKLPIRVLHYGLGPIGQAVVRQIAARDGLKVVGLPDLLEGSVGIVLASDDVAATAKLLVEFRKSHEEHLLVRGALPREGT